MRINNGYCWTRMLSSHFELLFVMLPQLLHKSYEVQSYLYTTNHTNWIQLSKIEIVMKMESHLGLIEWCALVQNTHMGVKDHERFFLSLIYCTQSLPHASYGVHMKLWTSNFPEKIGNVNIFVIDLSNNSVSAKKEQNLNLLLKI